MLWLKAAPVDGFVHQVHVRPGDVVQQGQLLAELSRDELQLERRRWQSEAQQQEHAYGEALARHERTQMVIALSRAERYFFEQKRTGKRRRQNFDGDGGDENIGHANVGHGRSLLYSKEDARQRGRIRKTRRVF